MTCDEVNELIIDYLEGELPRRQTRLIREHLDICDACRAEADQTESVINSVAEAVEDPGDSYFANLYPRIMQRIEIEQTGPWYKRFFRKLGPIQKLSLAGVPALSAAILIVALVFPGLLTNMPIGPSGKPIITTTRPLSINPGIIPNSAHREKVTAMSDTEVEDLHDALMLAFTDVLTENEAEGYGAAFASAPYDATSLPASLDDLDSEGLGDVIEKLDEMGENTI
jgi:hypothetical protein